ncbi:MAG: carbon storage regulator [Defluviitaleaceae bacterium]|nr:carbon storage regulator [Defluviitaleaceae bacterium]
MLLLSLDKGDYAMIGDNIRIKFSHMSENNTSMAVIGIDAPKDLVVLRSGNYEKMMNQRAEEGDESARETILKLNEERERHDSMRKRNANRRKERNEHFRQKQLQTAAH